MTNRDAGGLDPHQKLFMKLIRENSRRHRLHEVFRDFCEVAALALSNVCDLAQRDAREARYLQIAARYERAELERFRAMMDCIVESLELGFHDCLGQIFMALELGDHWRGQFFTPYHVASLMAKIVGVNSEGEIERKGFTTLMEPACGAGCMVIAAAEAMRDEGFNYQRQLHVTAIDIDATAVHMAYIQFTLLHIPAIVVHGNALAPDKQWSCWVTLAHVLGGWDRRLRQAETLRALARDMTELLQPEASAPVQPADQDEEEDSQPVPDLAKVRAAVVAKRAAQLDLF